MSRRVVKILMLLSCVHLASAQPWDPSKFRHYTIEDGLTDNNVVDIKQDSAGYIWLATHHGLSRFDGNIFKSFLKSSRYNAIPDNTIYSMDLFHDQLAIATNDGAQIISTKTLEQKNLFIPSSDALRYWSNACQYVGVDQAGNFGVSTKTGFYIFSRDGQLKKRFDYFTDKDIGHAWMMFGSHLYKSPDGNMLQRNSKGLFIYDHRRNYIGNASAYFPASVPSLAKLVIKQFPFFFISSSYLVAFNLETNSFDLVNFLTGEARTFPASFNI